LEQIVYNTSMLVDVTRNTLLNPVLIGGRITGWVDSGLDRRYFLQDVDTVIPTPRQRLTMSLRHRLQGTAIFHNLGNTESNYFSLGVSEKPSWWHDRDDKAKRIQCNPCAIDGLTHDDWVALLQAELFPGGQDVKKRARPQSNRLRPHDQEIKERKSKIGSQPTTTLSGLGSATSLGNHPQLAGPHKLIVLSAIARPTRCLNSETTESSTAPHRL